MPEATYSIEFAKTGRSKCKKCKEPIAKGEMRMCVSIPKGENSDFDLTSYHHVGCFRLPRKFTTGATKLAPEEFVSDHITDTTDDNSILPAKLNEIVELISQANNGSKSKGKAKSGDDDKPTLMGRIKAVAEASEEEPKKKKQKTEDAGFDTMVKAYKLYAKTKVDDLKDILRWNRQVLQGNKDFVLFKVMDGEVNGRLGMCGLCGGKLKFQEGDFDHVYCMGRFDEDNSIRIPCSCKGDRTDDKTPRCQPWYTEEPTDEEKEAMDKLIEQAQGDENQGDNAVGNELLAQAETMDWKLNNKKGIQAATAELVELVSGKVDIPASKNAKMALGTLVVGNSEKTAKEIVQIVIDKYGFKEDKEKKAAAKEAAAETVCANPKNAALLMAFQELAQLYFKAGNRNAGASYTKVSNTLKDLELEVTAENAMGLSKGKTKVPGVGKSSAEKMKEFAETGTIQKLEEKRADNA